MSIARAYDRFLRAPLAGFEPAHRALEEHRSSAELQRLVEEAYLDHRVMKIE